MSENLDMLRWEQEMSGRGGAELCELAALDAPCHADCRCGDVLPVFAVPPAFPPFRWWIQAAAAIAVTTVLLWLVTR